MVIDRCGLVCKYILIILHIITAVVGVVFFGCGLWLRFSENTRGFFSAGLDSSDVETGVYVLVGLGLVMMVVGVLGELSAYSQTRWALQTSSILLFLLAVADILVGVLSFNNRDQIGVRLGDFYSSMYDLCESNHNQAVNVTLSFINNRLNCCGVTRKLYKDICVKQSTRPTCPPIIVTFFDGTASLILGVFVGTGALLLIGVICSGVLGLLIFDYNPSPELPAKHPMPIPQPKPENVYADLGS